MTDLDQLLQQATETILKTDDLKSLDNHRVHYLGKKGQLTEYLKSLGQLPVAERPIIGQKVNVIKEKIQHLLDEQISLLQKNKINQQLEEEKVDVTLPGRKQSVGSMHPVTKTRDTIEALFSQMGFTVKDGPEVETDYYNFEALNIRFYILYNTTRISWTFCRCFNSDHQ